MQLCGHSYQYRNVSFSQLTDLMLQVIMKNEASRNKQKQAQSLKKSQCYHVSVLKPRASQRFYLAYSKLTEMFRRELFHVFFTVSG